MSFFFMWVWCGFGNFFSVPSLRKELCLYVVPYQGQKDQWPEVSWAQSTTTNQCLSTHPPHEWRQGHVNPTDTIISHLRHQHHYPIQQWSSSQSSLLRWSYLLPWSKRQSLLRRSILRNLWPVTATAFTTCSSDNMCQQSNANKRSICKYELVEGQDSYCTICVALPSIKAHINSKKPNNTCGVCDGAKVCHTATPTSSPTASATTRWLGSP